MIRSSIFAWSWSAPVIFTLASGLSAAACAGAAGSPATDTCSPGATQECVCTTGAGAQVCADDGQSWGTCSCAAGGGGGSAGIGTDAGTPGAGGSTTSWPGTAGAAGAAAAAGAAGAGAGGAAASECTPGETDGCGHCGTRTCQADGTWGSCQGEGCKPGNTQGSGCDKEKCDSKCEWKSDPSCSSGDCKSCSVGGYSGIKCCLPSSCSWSDQCCVPSGGQTTQSVSGSNYCCSGSAQYDWNKYVWVCD